MKMRTARFGSELTTAVCRVLRTAGFLISIPETGFSATAFLRPSKTNAEIFGSAVIKEFSASINNALNDFADGKIDHYESFAYGKQDGMLSTECNGGRQPSAMKDARRKNLVSDARRRGDC